MPCLLAALSKDDDLLCKGQFLRFHVSLGEGLRFGKRGGFKVWEMKKWVVAAAADAGLVDVLVSALGLADLLRS